MKAAMPNQAARFLAMRSVIVELALMDSHFGISKVFNYGCVAQFVAENG
jgi:hypothetical protein